MSNASEALRIKNARTKIRTKMVALGVCTNTDLIDSMATKIEAIVNNGSVNASVREGESYTIPAGYHSGSGTVGGISGGGGNYNLQSKTAIPSTTQQSIVSDSGYYGLSGVTVEPIPSNYGDVSDVNVAESEVLVNKIFVNSSGQEKTGTMPNKGAVDLTINALEASSITIPAGYHSGTGTVSISDELETELASI